MRSRRSFLTAIVALTIGCGMLSGVALAGAPSFALRPVKYDPAIPATKSYFVVDTSAGTNLTSAVRVTNVGDAAGTVRLYPVDATTGQTSGAVYRAERDPRKGVGSWISLDTSSVTLGAGESRVVPFTLSVPSLPGTGDRLGGIVGENATVTKGKNEGALQIQIRHLTVAAVLVRLPGSAARSLAVGGIAPTGGKGYQFLRLSLANTGDVMMKPTGSLDLRTAAGEPVADRTFQLDTLVPGTKIGYPLILPGQALEPGQYQATLSLRYGNRVLTDGDGVGGPLSLTETFAFAVSKSQAENVYRGAPQLTAPADSTRSGFPIALIVSWGLTGVAIVFAVIVVGLVRRRTAKA